MMKTRHDILTSDLCHEIDVLRARLDKANKEAAYWKNEFNSLLNGSIKHNNEMTGNLLTVLLEKK